MQGLNAGKHRHLSLPKQEADAHRRYLGTDDLLFEGFFLVI